MTKKLIQGERLAVKIETLEQLNFIYENVEVDEIYGFNYLILYTYDTPDLYVCHDFSNREEITFDEFKAKYFPPEPREFWINVYPDFAKAHDSIEKATAGKTSSLGADMAIETIHVREVL